MNSILVDRFPENPTYWTFNPPAPDTPPPPNYPETCDGMNFTLLCGRQTSSSECSTSADFPFKFFCVAETKSLNFQTTHTHTALRSLLTRPPAVPMKLIHVF